MIITALIHQNPSSLYKLPICKLNSLSIYCKYINIFESRHDKTNNVTVRPVKTDQPGHPPSLIRVFAVRSMGAKDSRFLHADSEDSD